MAKEIIQPEPASPPKPQTVSTDSLLPNPHNPRYLFDEEPLETLKASIQKVGILVPLTVYRATGSSKFTILDGQRRWICAQRLQMPEVPINEVTEPSVAQNIVTMFQIHKLRKDWDLMPSALKLGVLMDVLNEKRDSALADLTGLDVAVVVRCKKLLSYPEKYQDMMLTISPEHRMKADFFIELYPVLNDRSVRNAEWYSYDYFVDSMLRKFLNKLSGFRSVTDFRKIKSYLTAARAADREPEIIGKLGVFLDSDKIDIAQLEIDEARTHREAESLQRSVERLSETLESIDVELYAAEEDLWVRLERLLDTLHRKLSEAERRIH